MDVSLRFESHLGLKLADAPPAEGTGSRPASPTLPLVGTCELGEEHLLSTLDFV